MNYPVLAKELKSMEHKDDGDGDTRCNWCARNNLQRISKGTVDYVSM